MTRSSSPSPILTPPPPAEVCLLEDEGESCPGVTGEGCGNALRPGEEYCQNCGWALMTGGN